MNAINNGEHPDHHDDRPEGDRPAGVPADASGDEIADEQVDASGGEVADEQVDAALDQHIDVLVRGAAGRLRAAVADANERGRLTIDLPTAGSGSSEPSAGWSSTDVGDVMTDGQDREPSQRGKLDVGAYEIVVEADRDGPLPERDPGSEHDDDSVIVLGEGPRSRGERGDRGRQRRTLLAAAAATVVLALVGVGVWQLGGGSGDESSGTLAGDPDQRYLVAGDLPDGFEPTAADDDLSAPGDHQFESEYVVYGDSSTSDPWAGPLVVLRRSEALSPDHWEQPDSVQVEIDGREREPVASGGRDWNATVEPATSDLGEVQNAESVEGDVLLILSTFGLERDVLLSAMEQVDDPLTVGDAGLPEGFEVLARGPQPLMDPSSDVGRLGSFDGLSVRYAEGGEPLREGDSELGVMTLTDVDEQALTLPYLFEVQEGQMSMDAPPEGRRDLDVRDLSVRGHPAVLTRLRYPGSEARRGVDENGEVLYNQTGSPPRESLTVQWFEPQIDAMVVVSARNMDEDRVYSFIDGLREAEPGEVDALVAAHPEEVRITRRVGEPVMVEECAVIDGNPTEECATVLCEVGELEVFTACAPAPDSGAETCDVVEEESLIEECVSVDGSLQSRTGAGAEAEGRASDPE